MKRKFIETIVFTKRWHDMDLSDEDLIKLQNNILNTPGIGDIIEGTGGAIKLRSPLPNMGKSGGVRVIYIDIKHKEKVYLIICYSKAKQENLTDEQKKQVKLLVKDLKGEE